VHVACVNEALVGPKYPTLDPCVHFHPLKLPRGMNPIDHLKAARELDSLVSQLRPDIVDAHFSAAIFSTALARRRTWPAAEDHAYKNCAQIIDAGYTDDVASYLAISDAMVFPSQREGMPVCLMEALAMGVPVITRASRGCRDVVLPTGQRKQLARHERRER
jgi:glycosyltransferase involved in cell wall biosynthesis